MMSTTIMLLQTLPLYLHVLVLLNVFVIVEVHSLSQYSLSENLDVPYSLLTNTKWKVRLDVGLQPGTWMPKRYPGWAESGARLVVDADIEFTDELFPSNERSEQLVGPKDQTGVIRVNHLIKDVGSVASTSSGASSRSGDASDIGIDADADNGGGSSSGNGSSYYPSTFVSEKGTQHVSFTKGGWCIQRPTANVKNANGEKVRPEGILGFWLDCESGATRRDVEILPKTRIFFTTGVWDDPSGMEGLEDEYKKIFDDLQQLEERKKETEARLEKNWFNVIDIRKMFVYSEESTQLEIRKKQLERQSPPKNSARSKNGVLIAPTGSLVIKGNSSPNWLPGSEYLILGTCSIQSLS